METPTTKMLTLTDVQTLDGTVALLMDNQALLKQVIAFAIEQLRMQELTHADEDANNEAQENAQENAQEVEVHMSWREAEDFLSSRNLGLSKHGYCCVLKSTVEERHASLTRATETLGTPYVLRRLEALTLVNNSAANELFIQDLEWLRSIKL